MDAVTFLHRTVVVLFVVLTAILFLAGLAASVGRYPKSRNIFEESLDRYIYSTFFLILAILSGGIALVAYDPAQFTTWIVCIPGMIILILFCVFARLGMITVLDRISMKMKRDRMEERKKRLRAQKDQQS